MGITRNLLPANGSMHASDSKWPEGHINAYGGTHLAEPPIMGTITSLWESLHVGGHLLRAGTTDMGLLQNSHVDSMTAL